LLSSKPQHGASAALDEPFGVTATAADEAGTKMKSRQGFRLLNASESQILRELALSGGRLSRFGIEKRLAEAAQKASLVCPSLQGRRVSPHVLRHTTAMHLLQAGVDITAIALWLGHESPLTTHQYIEADLEMKKKTLNRLKQPKGKPATFKPRDTLLTFLETL
jgi:site-specific recombinase XerD